jgi:hypothetical protein
MPVFRLVENMQVASKMRLQKGKIAGTEDREQKNQLTEKISGRIVSQPATAET